MSRCVMTCVRGTVVVNVLASVRVLPFLNSAPSSLSLSFSPSLFLPLFLVVGIYDADPQSITTQPITTHTNVFRKRGMAS
jgi:hypothetical protein